MSRTLAARREFRGRLREAMGCPRLRPKTKYQYIRHVKRFADFVGRSADKATTEDVHRYQLWLASIGKTVPTVNVSATAPSFLLKAPAEPPRSARRGGAGPGAAPPPRRSQPGRDRPAARVGDKHQAQGGPEPDLCHRPAFIVGRVAQAHRYRQRPNGHPGRTGQGQEGSLCYSLAQPSRAVARMVGRRPPEAVDAA